MEKRKRRGKRARRPAKERRRVRKRRTVKSSLPFVSRAEKVAHVQ
jgi:hypothetical protein